MEEEVRVSLDDFRAVLIDKLEKHKVGEAEAKKVADIFTRNAAEGVISHSVLRVVRLIASYDSKMAIPGNMPIPVSCFAAAERYDANRTIGVIAASFAMERACELSQKYGIGMAALKRANHWMRGGYYGWLAAERGKVGICWTNTMPNLPSLGSKVSNIGNNPFIMAVPGTDGQHMILDTSMSQFSNGKLEVMRRAGKMLPVDGGYDESGSLTRVPGDIEKTKRSLPMGFWKGSSMSILLDTAAAILSDGDDTASVKRYITANGVDECDLSQVFIAVDPETLGAERMAEIEKSVKDNIHNAPRANENFAGRYPGERAPQDRARAMKEGILIPAEAWRQISEL